jgi:DNA-binding Lrp family transcriptional regulator
MDSGITEAELVEELRKAFENAGPDDAMTVKELSASLGLSVASVRRLLAPAVEAGSLKVVRVRRKRWDGLVTTVSAVRRVT